MRGEDGFTLIELLVAMVIGSIILLAGFQALERYSTTSASVTARTDNAQRARLGMDLLVRALRSQSCTGPNGPSVLAGTPDSISFVTDLGDGTTAPEKRTVTYDAVARRLQESRFPGTRTAGVISFGGSPASRTMLLANVGQDGSTPVFGFYAYDTQTPPRPLAALPTPLSDADRARVARITVAFRVGSAAGARDAGTGATQNDEVLLRSVDPSDPVPLPLCS